MKLDVYIDLLLSLNFLFCFVYSTLSFVVYRRLSFRQQDFSAKLIWSLFQLRFLTLVIHCVIYAVLKDQYTATGGMDFFNDWYNNTTLAKLNRSLQTMM